MRQFALAALGLMTVLSLPARAQEGAGGSVPPGEPYPAECGDLPERFGLSEDGGELAPFQLADAALLEIDYLRCAPNALTRMVEPDDPGLEPVTNLSDVEGEWVSSFTTTTYLGLSSVLVGFLEIEPRPGSPASDERGTVPSVEGEGQATHLVRQSVGRSAILDLAGRSVAPLSLARARLVESGLIEMERVRRDFVLFDTRGIGVNVALNATQPLLDGTVRLMRAGDLLVVIDRLPPSKATSSKPYERVRTYRRIASRDQALLEATVGPTFCGVEALGEGGPIETWLADRELTPERAVQINARMRALVKAVENARDDISGASDPERRMAAVNQFRAVSERLAELQGELATVGPEAVAELARTVTEQCSQTELAKRQHEAAGGTWE